MHVGDSDRARWTDLRRAPGFLRRRCGPLPHCADEAAGCGYPLPQPADPNKTVMPMALEVTAEIVGDTVRRLRRPVRSPLDRRWATAWYADLHTRDRPLTCWVEDVSADGAKLRVGCVPTVTAVGEYLFLALANVDAIAARVAWHRRDRIGVEFCQSQPWLVELVLRITETEDWFPTTAG
jgi:PilZ domain